MEMGLLQPPCAHGPLERFKADLQLFLAARLPRILLRVWVLARGAAGTQASRTKTLLLSF